MRYIDKQHKIPLLRWHAALAASTAVALTAGADGLHAQGVVAAGPEPTLSLPGITIFGAARDDRALLDTPNAESVVGAEQIRRRQPSTYQELLDDVPGLTIEGGPRGVSQEINIRGFQDEHVVLHVDGGRQNFNLAHRGRFFTDPMIRKQVVVLRGGASTLFGSGAIGGVLFVDTKDAEDVIAPGSTAGGEVQLGYNSNGDEFSVGATGATKVGPFDALIFASGRERGSDIEDGNGDDIVDSQIDSRNYLLKFGFEPTDALHFEANLNPADNPFVNLDALVYYDNT